MPTLDEHNATELATWGGTFTSVTNGIDCPTPLCVGTLNDTYPGLITNQTPPQTPVECPACTFKGYRIIDRGLSVVLTGDIGVNRVVPESPLHVGQGTGSNRLALFDGQNTSGTRVLFANNNNTADHRYGFNVGGAGPDQDKITLGRFQDDWDVQQRIATWDTRGRMGLGTDSPGVMLDIITGVSTNSGFHLGETIDEGLWITSLSPTNAAIQAGVEFKSGLWTARAPNASFIHMINGAIDFYNDSGLTDGMSYTPTRVGTFTTIGRFGWGTSTPTEKVNVEDDVAGNVNVLVENLNTAAGSRVRFVAKNGTVETAIISQANSNIGFVGTISNHELRMMVNGASQMSILTDGGVLMNSLKSGATQIAAGAAANELWKTASHATLPDNVLLIGV